MSRKRTLPREEFDGRVMLVINNDDGLSHIKFDLVHSMADVKTVANLFREYTEHGARWFWVETGVQVHLKYTESGYKWLIEDYREHSLNYKWFSSKSQRFANKLVERINSHLELKSAALDLNSEGTQNDKEG